jgi:hypothetical protein
MMSAYHLRSALGASLFALAGFALAPAGAQTTAGTSGTAQGRDVSAGTCGQGTTTATSVDVSGCADATAADGGTVNTSNRARVNSNVGVQHSSATARDDDERARSMTNTHARRDGAVRSRTMTWYKEKGERPVREVTTDSATPQQTTPKKKPR